MAGIYIHIPFCKTKCLYCDFYSVTTDMGIEKYLQAVCLELQARKCYPGNERIETIYIGGGTPSLLPISFYDRIFEIIYTHYSISGNPEITFEANPDDLKNEYLHSLHALPVNRLSMGVQSFRQEQLTFLNRRHSVRQVYDAVENARQVGFKNISMDLMYGLPGQTLSEWEYTLNKAIDLPIQHISAYHLIYEEGTPLYKKWKRKEVQPVKEQLSNDMFEILMDRLHVAGFHQYEISNFAKENFISRHNSSYWNRINYLGIGAAAHSYNIRTRSYNVADIKEYTEQILGGVSVRETEEIDDTTSYNEFIITSLRMMQGLSLNKLESLSGKIRKDYFIKQSQKYLSLDLLEQKGDIIRLTRKGIFVSDGIMADLLIVEDE